MDPQLKKKQVEGRQVMGTRECRKAGRGRSMGDRRQKEGN